MKFEYKATVFLSLLLVSIGHVFSQNSFQNLDFESVIPPLNRDVFFQVPIANGLPGWTVYYQGNPINGVLYNTRPIDDAGVVLIDSLAPFASFYSIQGSYAVLMKGSSASTPISSAAAIAQVGQIPTTALSLQYFGDANVGAVTFNGQPISTSLIGSGLGYSIFGGDISAYAGQTGELRFTMNPLQSGPVMLDNISFSSQAVPEPGVLGLSVLGGLLLGWRWRRKASRP